MKHPHIAYAFHVTYSSYSRVVSILITKAISVQIEEVLSHPDSCYFIVVIRYLDAFYTLVNVYLPPPFHISRLLACTGRILQISTGTILIAGDFNATLSPRLDRLEGTRHVHTALCDWMESYDWLEKW